MNGLARPILAGLVIREVLAPFTGHPFDFEIWVRLGAFIQSGASPYSLLPHVSGLSFNPDPLITSISYPPLPAFIFGGAYGLYRLLGSPSAYLYYFILKQPMVLSDLLVGVVMYKLVSIRGDPGAARKAATFWFYFPFGIIVSAMWGALDPPALLLILASLYAFETDRQYLAAGLLGLSIYLKLMPLIFLPIFLLSQALSVRRKLSFVAVALIIPLAGTLVPLLAFGWNYSGMYSAVAYQGSLPGFGGIGVFNAFSLVVPPPGPLTTALSLAWVPALAVAYAYAYAKKSTLVEGMLITVLLFSVFRPVTPEQWAIYPVALLLIMGSEQNWRHAVVIAGVASTFLLVNNMLLVRFFSPVSTGALAWDQFVDNASAFAEVRYALLLIVSTLFSAEAISTVAQKRSFLTSKLKTLTKIRPGPVVSSLAYLGVVTIVGGLLDFSATKMVTDWAMAFRPNVFLGLSWLSLYHVMLVLAFETMVVMIVAFSRRSIGESIGLVLRLTFLNVAASSLSLILYRSLEGLPVLSATTIYLVGSEYVTERAFVVFAITISVLGLFYLNELREGLLFLLRKIPQISSKASWGPDNADSLPSPP